MYRCSRCGFHMDYPQARCPSCNAILSGVRCSHCQYVGEKSEFVNRGNLCPKCQARVFIPGETRLAKPRPVAKPTCPFCGTEHADPAVACPSCGKNPAVIKGARKLTRTARVFQTAGILNILIGLCITLALGVSSFVFAGVGVAILLLGVWEIVNARLFWKIPPRAAWSPKAVAVMEMLCAFLGPIWDFPLGLVNLVSLSDENVRAFYADFLTADPLKQKRANRGLSGGILMVFGGLSVLTATLFWGFLSVITPSLAGAGLSPSDVEAFSSSARWIPWVFVGVGLIFVAFGALVIASIRSLRLLRTFQISEDLEGLGEN